MRKLGRASPLTCDSLGPEQHFRAPSQSAAQRRRAGLSPAHPVCEQMGTTEELLSCWVEWRGCWKSGQRLVEELKPQGGLAGGHPTSLKLL